jgi:hypothetical protein
MDPVTKDVLHRAITILINGALKGSDDILVTRSGICSYIGFSLRMWPELLRLGLPAIQIGKVWITTKNCVLWWIQQMVQGKEN